MKKIEKLIVLLVLTGCATIDPPPQPEKDPPPQPEDSISQPEKDSTSPFETHRNPLSKAEWLKKNKKYGEAEDVVSSMIASVPFFGELDSDENRIVEMGESRAKLSYLYYFRAGCWYNLKCFDKALVDYMESYNLENDPDVLYAIADCMYEEEMYDEAIERFDQYLAIENLDRREKYLALYSKAFCVIEKGELKKGFRDLRELQKEFPTMRNSIQKVMNQIFEEKKKLDSSRPR